MDFVADSLVCERRVRCLPGVDDFTPEFKVIVTRGAPLSTIIDSGPDFSGRVLNECVYRQGIRLRFIRPWRTREERRHRKL